MGQPKLILLINNAIDSEQNLVIQYSYFSLLLLNTVAFCSHPEGRKEDFLYEQQEIFYKLLENIVNPLCIKVMLVLYLTQALSMCTLLSIWLQWPLHVCL